MVLKSDSIFEKEYTIQEIEQLYNKVDVLENIFLDLVREIKTLKEESKESEPDAMNIALRIEKCILDSGITNGVGDLDGDEVANKL